MGKEVRKIFEIEDDSDLLCCSEVTSTCVSNQEIPQTLLRRPTASDLAGLNISGVDGNC